jgi:hypothetical protein
MSFSCERAYKILQPSALPNKLLEDRNLFACSQAGLVNNLNDSMSWGVFPLFFSTFGLGVERMRGTQGSLSGGLGVPAGPHRPLE